MNPDRRKVDISFQSNQMMPGALSTEAIHKPRSFIWREYSLEIKAINYVRIDFNKKRFFRRMTWDSWRTLIGLFWTISWWDFIHYVYPTTS